MPTIVENHSLRLRQNFEKGLGLGLEGKAFVVAAVHHHLWGTDVRREVNGVGGGNPRKVGLSDSSTHEEDGAVTTLNSRQYEADARAGTGSKERNAIRVDIVSRLQVIQSAAQISNPIDYLLAVLNLSWLRISIAFRPETFHVAFEDHSEHRSP